MESFDSLRSKTPDSIYVQDSFQTKLENQHDAEGLERNRRTNHHQQSYYIKPCLSSSRTPSPNRDTKTHAQKNESLEARSVSPFNNNNSAGKNLASRSYSNPFKSFRKS